ncbi:MAG: cyclopropane-fatty-acyl-phospholipid synthase, partial [Chloroflexi bacterium]|nr:cyclopropane-fatty-acyl-phospholipid synthase [Chloroflexota bacterium]
MTTKKHKFQIKSEKLLESAGISINGENPWDMKVHDDRLYARVFAEGSLGLGEAYMDGWWDSDQLDELISRCMAAKLTEQIPRNLKTLMLYTQARFANRQSKSRAFIAADVHYDLGNDLFAGTFDSRLTGSCGYWAEADELDASQDAKLDLICRKIGLKKGDRVFDIGCGWGAFMGYA